MLYTPATKKAMKLCFAAHKDQMDKSGVPYVFHPFHLAEQMQDEQMTIAALLHCSIRTVYNYRSFTQRHSRPDVGDLEQRVQLIGLNGIAARS